MSKEPTRYLLHFCGLGFVAFILSAIYFGDTFLFTILLILGIGFVLLIMIFLWHLISRPWQAPNPVLYYLVLLLAVGALGGMYFHFELMERISEHLLTSLVLVEFAIISVQQLQAQRAIVSKLDGGIAFCALYFVLVVSEVHVQDGVRRMFIGLIDNALFGGLGLLLVLFCYIAILKSAGWIWSLGSIGRVAVSALMVVACVYFYSVTKHGHQFFLKGLRDHLGIESIFVHHELD